MTLRSVDSRKVSHILIVNRSAFQIEVIWMNNDGNPTKYVDIPKGRHWSVKTYEGHPWIFLKAGTRERMNVLGGINPGVNSVLMPKGYAEGEEERVRIVLVIRPPVTLKERCFCAIYSSNVTPESVKTLSLPLILEQEFKDYMLGAANSQPS